MLRTYRQFMVRRPRISRAQLYAWGTAGVLLSSTLLWAVAASHLQQANADQLVNGFLFESQHTLAGAVLPASHTQLMKWPLFAFLRVFHFSAGAYLTLTVALALLTVGAFAYLLYRLNKNPLVFGTICLTLASVLALIPAHIFDDVTSPLNMAMLTGRNVEYIVYIGALVLCVGARRLKSWQFFGTIALLSVLAASDHLFLLWSLGGSLVLLASARLAGHRQLSAVAGRWAVGSALAWIGAAVLQAMANRYVTNVVTDAAPYGVIKSWHVLGPAIAGTGKALEFNWGLSTHVGPLAVLPTIFNAGIVIAVLFAVYGVARKTALSRKQPVVELGAAMTLSAMLLATALVALLAYVCLDRSYIGDARYLTIVVFAGFVLLATYLRSRPPRRSALFAVAGAALLALTLGLAGTLRHTSRLLAADQLQQRNQRIAQALADHRVEFLVGSYWRVFPIRLLSKQSSQAVMPLDGCINPAQLLGSSAWRPDLRTHSFAYILSLQAQGVAAPRCFVQTVTFRYGPPSSTTLIAGNSRHPQELLLFYDQGAADRRSQRD